MFSKNKSAYVCMNNENHRCKADTDGVNCPICWGLFDIYKVTTSEYDSLPSYRELKEYANIPPFPKLNHVPRIDKGKLESLLSYGHYLKDLSDSRVASRVNSEELSEQIRDSTLLVINKLNKLLDLSESSDTDKPIHKAVAVDELAEYLQKTYNNETKLRDR